MTLAIVDSGINTTNTEFAGRISSASADVVGNRGIQGEDDHGNFIALMAAAARNDSGILGIAFDATIQVLRADTPGTCATAVTGNKDTGCTFSDNNIAAGVDAAVNARARVINISLGGSVINRTLANAIGRASAAGIVVVVSAGNDGASTDPTKDGTQPDPFATTIQMAGGTNVIIAGSVDNTGTISTFSNRAGAESQWYLAALGQRLCCVYSGSTIQITTTNGQRFVTLGSGTSFAAPQITGAVALLAQAFPNLTGAQIVDLLLRTARDAGTVGTDAIYGRGILDIAAAFSPQGTLSLAGTLVPVSLGSTSLALSPAMGDAAAKAGSLGTVILDGYRRAFAVDLAHSIRSAQLEQHLYNSLALGGRSVALGNGALSVAFTIGRQGTLAGPLSLSASDARVAQVLAASVVARIAPGRQLAFGIRQDARGLVGSLVGHDEPAFMIAGSGTANSGFRQDIGGAFALRQQLGRWGLTVSAESGAVVTTPIAYADTQLRRHERYGMARIGAVVDRRFGALDAAFGFSLLREDRTVLGARFSDSLGGGGASTLFGEGNLGWQVAPRWRLGTAGQLGWTRASGNALLGSGSSLLSSAWSVDLMRQGVFNASDSVGLRIAQPLRVESGGVSLRLPIDYSYETSSATFADQRLSLAPQGREIIGELAWRTALWRGALASSLFIRRQPGHYAALPVDKGVAMRWSRDF
ncbi:S8 family peptidase [Novosphingobium sp.]|uniref:S8 family peptidase n=1 Tax=Novosphingobium sp. TaxID=1874826 RepID=UPI0025FD914D|nr:S8 family peptidase [Novosphingobium sp.]